jgi:uncharacterized protein involved in exopolysaccharide biosynthesis
MAGNKTPPAPLSIMNAARHRPHGANGADMKNILVLFVIVSGVLLTSGHAAAQPEYQPATVVSVESRAIPSNDVGDNPSDAPLQPEVYSYEIGILLGGTVYRTSYDSAFDALPSAFAPNHSIQVNLKKHVMEVELPGDHTVQMPIEARTVGQSVSGLVN